MAARIWFRDCVLARFSARSFCRLFSDAAGTEHNFPGCSKVDFNTFNIPMAYFAPKLSHGA